VAALGTLSTAARDTGSDLGLEPSTGEQVDGDQPPLRGGVNCLPTSFGVQRTTQVEATFSCIGTFGYGFQYGHLVPADTGGPDIGFMSPPGSDVEYLYGGAVWIGGIVGDDTLVSVGADGWLPAYEMFPPEWQKAGSVEDFDYPTAHSMRAQYSDTFTVGVAIDYFGRPHIPLPVEIAMRSHTFDGDDYNEIVIYDMVITNIGAAPIEDMFVGLYMDGDVGYIYQANYVVDDVAGSIASDTIAYIIDSDGDLWWTPARRALALKVLMASWTMSTVNFNWWRGSGISSMDFGPRQRGTLQHPFRDFGTGGLGTPEGDVNKYYVLSSPEWDYDQVFTASVLSNDSVWLYPSPELAPEICFGTDARFLLSVGSFDVPPGVSERLLFATFTGDSVHVDPDNVTNLPENPEAYLANLDFTNVLANAALASEMADSLMNPTLPPIGLRLHRSNGTAVVRWDPWVFDNVTGYEVYLNEVPPSDMPYPALAPPWWRPDNWDVAANLPPTTSTYDVGTLDSHKVYAVSVANETAGSTGEKGPPLFFSVEERLAAPETPVEFVFSNPGEPATLTWSISPGVEIDHYNIYRFEDSVASGLRYHPFYDEGCMSDVITPLDTFEFPASGKTYYYYAMSPFAQVQSRSQEWSDPSPEDGMVYCISAIGISGLESDFSTNIMYNEIEPRTKDILVISDNGLTQGGVVEDTIWNFYSDLLTGYSYDLYDHADSIKPANCPGNEPICFDWHDFMRYRLLIIDDALFERTLTRNYEDPVRGLTRYLLSGGRVAHFGAMMKVQNLTYTTPLSTDLADYWLIRKFFGFDSVTFMGMGVCPGETWCQEYTGVNLAESVVAEMPDVAFDTTRDPFNSFTHYLWPGGNSMPNVATMSPVEGAQVTYLARTLYPGTSVMEGRPIGIKAERDGYETYAFGFHLWYMEPGSARELIEAILPPPAKTTIEPDTLYAFMANAIDPDPVYVYLGNLPDGYSTGDVDPATLVINNAVVPFSWTVLPSHPGYDGEVLQLEFSVVDLLGNYGLLWGFEKRAYNVTGRYLNGDSLATAGMVVLGGHVPGDVTGDGVVDISDLIQVVGYMFQQGEAPGDPAAADVNGDCHLDISDLVWLIDYMFDGGEAPRPGCFVLP